ncbi:little elongation complex subunit 2 [Lepisosteus oculatus]|uniref:little elongation complex subunit 2 n=1 Tax=Lepisosteus oculatus TaxID=7918 RepID=UPI00371E4F8B
MELNWDVAPKNGTTVFFSREVYDNYSLAPNIKELWAVALSPPVKAKEATKEQKCEANDLQPKSTSSVQEEKAPTSAPADTKDVFPEPKVPYPCLSGLTQVEQKMYIHMLTAKSKKLNPHEMKNFKRLQELVQIEVPEYMKFLQNAARICKDDYNSISEGAARYSEEYLRACSEKVKNYPEVYVIHEMTSMTGGKFSQELSLNFEKHLLSLGQVKMFKAKPLLNAKGIQMATDYESVAAEFPPEKKACIAHTDISSDMNAESLCMKYSPHVSMTSQALYTLLNNHGPDYNDSWELPLCVKKISGEGESVKKVVFIDSPLLKREITVREKNQIFHKESIHLLLKSGSLKQVSEVLLNNTTLDPVVPWTDRRPVSFDDMEVTFEADFTDLETFGESSSSSKMSNSKSTSKNLKTTASCKTQEGSQSSDATKQLGKSPATTSEDLKSPDSKLDFKGKTSSKDDSWIDFQDSSTFDSSLDDTSISKESDEVDCKTMEPDASGTTTVCSSSARSPVMQQKQVSKANLFSSDADSDDERLVIDDPLARARSVKGDESLSLASASAERPAQVPEPVPDTPRSPSPEHGRESLASTGTKGIRRALKRPKTGVSKDCDQLGQILKMQCALLKPSSKATQEPMSPQANTNSLPATAQSHARPLVKACVSSFLEASQRTTGAALAAPAAPHADCPQALPPQKRLLQGSLSAVEEDDQEYRAPQEGNLLYQLYSLGDMLLLVRSTIESALAKTKRGFSKVFPVYVLPKLEYQLGHGVEILTKSEACRLWVEKLLHSNTMFYIGHIDALTSKLFMLDEFLPDSSTNAFVDFKPANMLNILHHLLNKILGLQEGRYLLSHRAGEALVTISRACDGMKVTRATLNLHEAHSSPPRAPSSGVVPWVPVDSSRVLDFHVKQGRVPCTFPPRPAAKKQGHKVGVAKGSEPSAGTGTAVAMETKSSEPPAQPGQQPGGAAKKKKKNKGKRANRALKRRQKKLQQKAQATA